MTLAAAFFSLLTTAGPEALAAPAQLPGPSPGAGTTTVTSSYDGRWLVTSPSLGEHVGETGVHYFQVPWLTISAAQPLTVNVDGEPGEERHLEYRARPRDLLVHVAHLPGDD